METTQWRHGGGGGTTPWRHVNSRRDLPCDRLHSVTFRGFGARETLSVSFQLDLLSSISIFFSPLLSLVFMNIFIYTPSFFFFFFFFCFNVKQKLTFFWFFFFWTDFDSNGLPTFNRLVVKVQSTVFILILRY